MIPWERMETAEQPGGGKIELWRRGTEFSVRLDGLELMNSRSHGSEEALAELACTPFAAKVGARVLVGGLGLGFTLAAALKVLAPSARLVVAELVPAVVDWNRGPLADLAGRPLNDRRVTVRTDDVGRIYLEEAGAWDAILLDVDNGPGALSRRENAALYGRWGLARAHAALRPGGILGVWSAAPSGSFTYRLRGSGFQVDVREVRGRGEKGGHHTLWIAKKVDPRQEGGRQPPRRPERL